MSTKTLTYHAPINYGSFFQAYALQQQLMKLGYENEIIDLQTPELKKDYALFRSVKSIRDVAKNTISLVHYHKLKDRQKKFEKARNKYLSLTKKYESLTSYISNEGSLDDIIYIAGSDQIWNTNASDFTSDYFLPGFRNKMTFSVSGGKNISEQDLIPYKNEIMNFACLSVREKELQNILNSMGLRNVKITLDPTMLLSNNEYGLFVNAERFIKKKYIFLYSVKCNHSVLKLANEIGKYLSLPVITTFNTYRSEKNSLYGVKTIYNAGPNDFLNMIQNAEIVLSDSFHGNIFSILMQKKFYYLASHNKNGALIRDDRIDGLLEELNLENRRIQTGEIKESIDLEDKIDFDHVNDIVNGLRRESIDYLRDSIQFIEDHIHIAYESCKENAF